MKQFDHVILGTGQATATLMGGLLPSGQSIAIIEANRIGGTCVNTGCTPTKALVASARVAHVINRAPEYGIYPGSPTINFQEVMARMDTVRTDSHDGLEDWITSEDQITLFIGQGRFVDEHSLQVGDEVIQGGQIYINVGTRPRIPDIPGLDGIPWLDNASLLEMKELPEHLIIVGGGYVGLEFSQIFRRFGSRVSLISRANQLVHNEDEDVALEIKNILASEGIEIYLDAQVQSVDSVSSGGIITVISQDGNETEISGSHILLATGRIPNSDTLNGQAAGLHIDKKGFIQVDDHCRTNVDNVFAVGDVNGRGAFTHTAVNDAEIVLDYLHGGPRKLSDRITAYALFIDPALGRVGLTEKEALKKGHNVLKACRDMAKISRAKEMGETKGFAKILVDADTDMILGASILGPGGDEVVNMFAAYMYSGLPCKSYRKSMLIHPTISELMPWMLDSLQPVH